MNTIYGDVPFVRNQPANYWSDREMIALLYLKVDRREVEHDGYCSDPGDDVGEWVYDVTEIYQLNQIGKDFFAEAADHYGNVRLDHLKNSLESDSLGCQCGSNYCGYHGSVVIKSGRIISPEYMVDLGNHSNVETMAYFIGEKDSFTQDSGVYWNQALDHVQELVLLSIQVTRATEKNRKHRQKKNLLQDALAAEGMTYRSDSKLCQKWIDGESDKTLEEVVQIMAECKWCIEYHEMFQKMREYSSKNPNHNITRSELFSLIKAEILLKNPLPADYPWKAEVNDVEEGTPGGWFW